MRRLQRPTPMARRSRGRCRDGSVSSTRWRPSRASAWKSSRGRTRVAGRAAPSELPTARTSFARGWSRQGENDTRRGRCWRRAVRAGRGLRRHDPIDDARNHLRDRSTVPRSDGRERVGFGLNLERLRPRGVPGHGGQPSARRRARRRRWRLVHRPAQRHARPPRPGDRRSPRDRPRRGFGAARRDRRCRTARRGSPTAA